MFEPLEHILGDSTVKTKDTAAKSVLAASATKEIAMDDDGIGISWLIISGFCAGILLAALVLL